MSDTLTFILIIMAGVIAFGVAIALHAHAAKQRMHRCLLIQFGKIPEREYSLDEQEIISHYYRNHEVDGFEIDDITWGDLEMDLLFRMVNNTQSSAGQEYLYYLLRKPEFSKEKLQHRKELMDYFTDHEEERLGVQMAITHVGRMYRYSVSDYIELLRDVDTKGRWKHYACLGALIAAAAVLFVDIAAGIGAIFVVMVANMLIYFGQKSEMDPYIQSMQYILRLFKGADLLSDMQIPQLQEELDTIRQIKKNFRRFRFGAGIVVSTNPTSGPEQIALDYLRMVLHIDFLRFYQMMKHINNNMEGIEQLIAGIGFLDAMIGAASFRQVLPSYSIPFLNYEKKAGIKLVDAYHPLLERPVTNSIQENHNILLTGSNASGKSTFLKTVAVNALFAQTLCISFAREYRANFFRIYTSMALKDNLLNHESYYIVEIKSLKRILDAAREEVPMLCFVDEVLRGTNTVERIAASVEILKSIDREHVMCFAATHDIELTHLLKGSFGNYHFTESIVGNDIEFDYHLYKGRATSRNAIRLLGLMGYDQEIIDRAEERTHMLEKV